MFDRYSRGLVCAALCALMLAPWVGCQSGRDVFAALDTNGDGVLTVNELDHNQDDQITTSELGTKATYPRSVETFMADGASADGNSLTREQFNKALLGNRMPAWQLVIIVALVFVVPIGLGTQMANAMRMQDYGWKLSLIFFTVVAGAVIVYFGWPPKRGIDLSGGVILVYDIDVEETLRQNAADAKDKDVESTGAASIDVDDLIRRLRQRIDPGGVMETVVRKYGERQIEIIIPEVSDAEIERIKQIVAKTGQLEFFIVANHTDHSALIGQAIASVGTRERRLYDRQQRVVGRWVPAAIQPKTRDSDADYRGAQAGDVMRALQGSGTDFVAVDLPESVQRALAREGANLKNELDRLGYRKVEVLMVVDPRENRNITGTHLASAGIDLDQNGKYAVAFEMNGRGTQLLGQLTSRNLPDQNRNFYRRLAIVMDGELLSAPRLITTIQNRGQITGDFSYEEVDELVGVLKAGKLPAVLRKDPISEFEVSALLGEDTIRAGAFAILLSLAAVLAFMVLYYHFAGIVACAALMINLLMIFAVMIFIKATFSLPGFAGLVLTVGMSVDANVLIYERIREELAKGATLRMAIRNGFARATSTIVDANLTTLITGIVLYVIGTDQIRGFAVTLILGILMSMYTAIFCARVVFEIAERRRWLTKLTMMQFLTETNFDFLSRRRLFIGASIVLIAVGMAALVARGKTIFDIDFNGGTSVNLLLRDGQAMPIAEVRKLVEGADLGDVSVTAVNVEKYGADRSYIINSSITGEEPPQVGDPATYSASQEAKSKAVVVTAVNEGARTVDLQVVGTNEAIAGVAWANVNRDGVEIVQSRL
ncbi:MAG: protein translocase subunit SecD, partial [Planctomycetales bacterium]|nr:protein translocase subunit SecD [Planctomycetales bacterium]